MNRLTFKINLAPPASLAQHLAAPFGDSKADYNLSLSCPSVALFDLALAFENPDDHADRLHQVLRVNPTILLFALDRYRHFKQAPAESAVHLVAWSQTNLLPALLQQHLPICTATPIALEKNRQLLKRFFAASDNSSCRKALDRWIQNHAEPSSLGQASDVRRKWLGEILAKCFCPDGFHVVELQKKTTQKSTFNATLSQWTHPPATNSLPARIRSLLKLAATASQTKVDYLHQLQAEKLAAMKQLAYGASHEINNPLANVATRAQTMLADEDHPEKRTKLATIYQQAMRAHEMISDLMLFAHPPATNATPILLRQLIRRFIGEHEKTSPVDEAITTNIFVGPGIDRACLDQTQFVVVLQMLARNSQEAIRATKDATGEIDIRFDLVDRQAPGLPQRLQLLPTNTFLQVSVQDNGIGVDARVRRHLFDPFFSGREAGRGLGFGLSKTWRIIEQHGGEIILDEAHTQGTRFVFWLPQQD